MFIVAGDYSVIPYNLPNLSKLGTQFSDFVTEQEEKALRDILGDVLYDAFVVGIASLPAAWLVGTEYDTDDEALYGGKVWKSLIDDNVGNVPAEDANWTEVAEKTRWVDLRDGVAYEDEDGKIRRWDGMKTMLKPLIYSLWLRTDFDTVTGIGVVVGDGENSTVVNPGIRIVMGQNDFANICGSNQYQKNTLFQYLYLSEDKYLDVVAVDDYETIQEYIDDNFIDPGKENEFDL